MSNERIDLKQFEGHTEGPWKAGIDCPEDFEMGEPHEENFHFSLHEFWAVIPGTDAWRGARDGEWENPNEWHGYSEREPKQLRADVSLMAAGPDLIAELKRCYDLIDCLEDEMEFVLQQLHRPIMGGLEWYEVRNNILNQLVTNANSSTIQVLEALEQPASE